MKKLLRIALGAHAILLAPPPALAAEPVLQYQGVRLGDAPAAVLAQATRAYPWARLLPREQAHDRVAIRAGDQRGSESDTCAYDDTPATHVPCLSVYFGFASARQGGGLTDIHVERSFGPGTGIDAFVAGLVKDYGPPRLRSIEVTPASPDGPGWETTSLLWGGERTPPGALRLSAFPADDREKFGGKYVSALVDHQDGRVIGATLRLVDSPKTDATLREHMAEVERAATLQDSGAR